MRNVKIQTTTADSLMLAGAFLRDNKGFELEALCALFGEIADLRAKLDEYYSPAHMQSVEDRTIKPLRAKLDEAYGLLHMMFTAYENGADCYEDPEEQCGYLGKAIKLDEAVEHRIADVLNERRPAIKEQEKPDQE